MSWSKSKPETDGTIKIEYDNDKSDFFPLKNQDVEDKKKKKEKKRG